MQQDSATATTNNALAMVPPTTDSHTTVGNKRKEEPSSSTQSSTEKKAKKSTTSTDSVPSWARVLDNMGTCKFSDIFHVQLLDENTNGVEEFMKKMVKDNVAKKAPFSTSIYKDFCKGMDRKDRRFCVTYFNKKAVPKDFYTIQKNIEAIREGMEGNPPRKVLIFAGPSLASNEPVYSCTKMFIRDNRLYTDAKCERPCEYSSRDRAFYDDKTDKEFELKQAEERAMIARLEEEYRLNPTPDIVVGDDNDDDV